MVPSASTISNKFFRIFFINFNIKNIYVGKNFKQYTFAFHNRFAGFRANIAQSQNSGSIADNSNQISLCRVYYKHFLYLLQFLYKVLQHPGYKQAKDPLCFCFLWLV